MINWPKRKVCTANCNNNKWGCTCGSMSYNAAIEACKKAFEKRIAMHKDTTDWNEGGRLAQEYLNRSMKVIK